MFRLRQLLTTLLGDFKWTPPDWLLHASLAAVNGSRAHRRLCAGIALSLLVLGGTGWWTYRWYQRRPKPFTVSVTVESPGVTPLEKDLVPRPLVIRFGESVARLGRPDWAQFHFPGEQENSVYAKVTS